MPRTTSTANEAAALKRQQLNNISNHLTSQHNANKQSTNDPQTHNNGTISHPSKRKRREEKLRLRNQRDSDATGKAHEQGNSRQSTSNKKRLEDRMTPNDQARSTQMREASRERPLNEQDQRKTKHPKRRKKSRSPNKHGNNGMDTEDAADVHGSTVAQEAAPVFRKEQPGKNESTKSAEDVLDDREGTTSSGAKPISKEAKLFKAVSLPSSPPSSNQDSFKRSIAEVDAELPEHTQKKQRLSPARSVSPKQIGGSRTTQKQPKKILSDPYKAPNVFAPVVAIPECKHTYKHWNNDSIPILHSAHFQRHNPATLPNNPSAELRVKALSLLEKPGGFDADDLGRPKVPKTGPTKVLSDMDLYLMVDGKVYVATERGLILAAKYLTLAGISDTTPVRFNGIKPAWVKASIERRFVRRVLTSTYDPDAPDRENPFPPLPAGDLGLMKGYIVQVYQRNLDNGRAFGRRLDNNLVGWFNWDDTEPMNSRYEPWDECVFTLEQYEASANNPVLPKPSTTMSTASTRQAKPQPSRLPTAAPPPTTASTNVAVKPVTPTQAPPKTDLKVTGEQRTAAVRNPATDLNKRPAKMAKTETTNGTKSIDAFPPEVKQEQKAKSTLPEEKAQPAVQATDVYKRPTKVIKFGTASEAKPSSVSPAGVKQEQALKTSSPKSKAQVAVHAAEITTDGDKKAEIALENKAMADASPSNKSSNSGTCHHSPPGMRALYDNTIEDEVDWGDEDL